MKDKRRTKKRRDQKNRRREKLNKSNESERIDEVEGCRAEEDSEKSNEIRGEIRRGEKTRNT